MTKVLTATHVTVKRIFAASPTINSRLAALAAGRGAALARGTDSTDSGGRAWNNTCNDKQLSVHISLEELVT